MTVSHLTARSVPNHGKLTSRFGTNIQYLVVHHWAGINGGDSRLLNPSADVSTNYILYGVGELVNQVPEEFRAWTSGSWTADAPGITVETQNSGVGGDWPVSDAALEMLARLAADLCVRYGWGRLDRSRVRGHREFASTACPGPYLWARLDWIVDRGNQILDGGTPTPEPKQEDEEIMAIYLRPTGNSSPTEAGNPGSSRIWAGDNREISGAVYSGTWERSDDGSVRRLFPDEWAAIQRAYAAAGRKVPLSDISPNELEKMYLVTRAAPKPTKTK